MTKLFVSYAQNGEDVMLYRALRGVERGFYVDVGAGEPEAGSVTCAFHQRGWRGINLEPAPGAFERLATARPDDINLNIAVGDRNGDDGDGLSTTVSGQIESQPEHRSQNTKINLPVRTLTSILGEYVNGTVHFLKIGVGGGERAVLAGTDLRRFRPWIVVVEATSPTSGIPTHQDWEHLLLDADYRFVWFDGLNRFYLSAEKIELAAALRVQPNVFDGFIRSTEADALAQLAQARSNSLNPAAGKRQPNPARNMAQIEIAAQRSRSDELENEVVRLEAERDAWMQAVFEANRHAAHLMQVHQTSLDTIHRLEGKLRRQPTYVLAKHVKTLWKMGRRRLRSVAKRLGKW